MNLNYRTFGEGKPLFILHGLFGSSDNWISLGRKFAENYRIIIPDLRNHGQSPHSDLWDYKTMAGDIHQLAEDLGLEKILLIGHSMGGKVAMQVAEAYPGFVEKLVVADIAPKQYPIQHRTILDAMSGLNLDQLPGRKDADEQLAATIPELGVRQFLLKNLERVRDKGFRWKLNLAVISEQIANVGEATVPSSGISIPTLFIRGTKSDYVEEKDIAEIPKYFTNAQFATIENAGHWLHAEQPQAFMDQVMAFLHSS